MELTINVLSVVKKVILLKIVKNMNVGYVIIAKENLQTTKNANIMKNTVKTVIELMMIVVLGVVGKVTLHHLAMHQDI
jgi:hypothetical protein